MVHRRACMFPPCSRPSEASLPHPGAGLARAAQVLLDEGRATTRGDSVDRPRTPHAEQLGEKLHYKRSAGGGARCCIGAAAPPGDLMKNQMAALFALMASLAMVAGSTESIGRSQAAAQFRRLQGEVPEPTAPCRADIAGEEDGPDGVVNVLDLLALLNVFQCSSHSCLVLADIASSEAGGPPWQDGEIGVRDLLFMLSVFRQPCHAAAEGCSQGTFRTSG
eukprot:SAG22_NODE_2179_length_2878_cov_1.678661_2_plen_221_part_00